MAERAKYTMRDVARLAGVSTSTVSAVMNGTVPVGADRKSRVQAAMAALDYQPDAIARSLKTGKSNAIGIIVPDITNAFYPEVVRGAEEAAQAAGYSVLLCDSNENYQSEDRHLSALFSRRVDGILLACCVDSRAHEAMARRRLPVVYIDRLPPAAGASTVCTDNVRAGQLAADHLIKLGHKRIGMLAGHLELSPHHDRLEGFRKAMQESHLPILDEYLISGNVQVEDGLAAGHRLLALANPPTAILASNNKLLLGILQAVDEKNIRIPEELSVLGFDDYLWNRHFNPTLTAVAQPTHEIGKKSFELLLELIRRNPEDISQPIQLRLSAELRVRNSTAPPRK
jgi:LacI family transcriptional regulator, galactose operon repressor